MLQILIDGQAAIRKEMSDGQNSIKEEMRKGFKNVNSRLDKQGKSLAYLEDDAPTRDEHDKLDKRVTKIERKLQIQTS